MKVKRVNIILLIISTIIFQAILAYVVYNNVYNYPLVIIGSANNDIIQTVIWNVIVAIISTIVTYKILKNKPLGINILANMLVQIGFMNMGLHFSPGNIIKLQSIIPKILSIIIVYCFSKIKDQKEINKEEN